MKRILLTIVMVLSLCTFAFANSAKCKSEIIVTSKSQAQEIVKQKIASLKGFTSYDAVELKDKNTVYKVEVLDASGNKMYYLVFQHGYAFGPLTANDVQKIYDKCQFMRHHGCSNEQNCNGQGHNNTCISKNMEECYGNCQQNSKNKTKNNSMCEPVVITKEQAKNAAEKYLQELKGYTIEKVAVNKRKNAKHESYVVYVKDTENNNFIIRVNAWGRVSSLMAKS